MIEGGSVQHLQTSVNGAAFCVIRAIDQTSNAGLHQRARAHRARLDRHVQSGAVEAMISSFQRGRAQSHHFRMRRGVAIGNGTISGRCQNLVFQDDQRSDRDFTAQSRGSRLIDGQEHVFVIGHVCGAG
jgi:hypothetical protein